MRVLLLIQSATSTGGAEKVVDNMTRLFIAAGLDCVEASFDARGAVRRFENDAAFYPIGPIPPLPIILRPLEYFIAAFRLRKLKRNLKIDVTISNLWRSDLVSIISGGSDRKISLCHINIIGNPSNRLLLKFRTVVGFVYRRFDRVIAVNQVLAQEVEALYRLDEGKVDFVNNFVLHLPVKSALPDDGVRRFVWCGRFAPEKNVGGLLHAWTYFTRLASNVQLLLVGDGPQRDELEKLAANLGLRVGFIENKRDNVVFLGAVTEPQRYMSGACALLLTSTSEGLPMVVLEALTLGLPVLASDCPAGGVRAALVGEGSVNPKRTDAEQTICGSLLPIPTSENERSIQLWSTALIDCLRENGPLASWRDGAFARAKEFSPRNAEARWLEILAADTK